MSEKTQKVYAAIAAVAADLAGQGISKEQQNRAQGYSFRGIDDVLNALAPLLAKHKLLILPRMVSRECVEGKTKKGDPLFKVTVHGEFDFVSAEDASKHTVTMYGEAMDTGDKATNKAMSAAYKYAAFQAFCIPVDVEDADSSSPAPAPSPDIPSDAFDPRGYEPEEEGPPPAPPKPSECITPKQQKMLFGVLYVGLAGEKAKADAVAAMKAMLANEGIAHSNEIPKDRFNVILGRLPECNAKCKARVAELAKEKRK